MPSTLKAWIGHIVRIRRTFQSTSEDKIGLLRDRPVVVGSAHAGYVSSSPMQPDFLTLYLQAIFKTIGIHSLESYASKAWRAAPRLWRALEDADGWIERRLPELIGSR